MNIKCHGCKKDSGVSGKGTLHIGPLQKRTGFIWIPSAGDTSPWLCPNCAEQLLIFVRGITELVGELYTYPPTLQELLERELAKGSKA